LAENSLILPLKSTDFLLFIFSLQYFYFFHPFCTADMFLSKIIFYFEYSSFSTELSTKNKILGHISSGFSPNC